MLPKRNQTKQVQDKLQQFSETYPRFDSSQAERRTSSLYVQQPLYITMLVFDFLYLINIIANCFTGFVSGKNHQYVVLNKRNILWRYAKTWLFVDAVVLACNIIDHKSKKNQTLVVAIVCSKVLRIPILLIYFNNIAKVLRMGVPLKTAIEVVLLLVTYVCWNIVFQFAVEYMTENSFNPTNPQNCSWLTIGQLWNASSHDRFLYSIERAVGMLRENVNMNLIEQRGCFEIFFIIFWLIAELLVLHCSFKYMIAFFGTESARAKYYMMSRQVEAYMNNRRFPPRIKKKVLKFYAIRFQSHFFVESRMMACVSGQLRNDMVMYTGRQLVRELFFLKQLPRLLLMEITLRFKLVIFIEGDIIFKIHTIGDEIYFIHKGTVAIYSESGREVCHLEDGEYFGGIALVMKHRLRTASAVAVTNCELFSLSRDDFETISCYPTVYDEIKRVATQRQESMRVLDEHFRLQQHIRSGELLEVQLG
ncbi:potassium/sodium hyperpolarization-activated cyclic nucleotide-gated channel 2-like isoform X2 [Choristoneura fumiferana]|uniref:potassium/sodium hyperpolarization-activated cyclic nucleotide-gated channel 2-like isoform X2 n=1 Tax=Choristoneura fumiferana TaxID=7141 RepID=UPI003D158723